MIRSLLLKLLYNYYTINYLSKVISTTGFTSCDNTLAICKTFHATIIHKMNKY